MSRLTGMTLSPGSELYGRAFENWVFHELSTCLHYLERDERLSHWRLATGTEVDFVTDDLSLAVEDKASAATANRHFKGLRQLVKDHPDARRRCVVCLESQPRRTEDGMDILPAAEFVQWLWAGELFR